MISAWHLIWIIPLAAVVGFVTAAVLSMAKESDGQDPWEGQ